MDKKNAMQKKLDQSTLDRCSKFLSKKNDPNIAFIMQSIVGILRGQNSADPTDVQIYLKKQDGLNLALNRIKFSAENLSVGHFKQLFSELVGKRSVALGICKEVQKGDGEVEFEPTGEEFPEELIDFLIFYKLLIIICKLCIAKHDEGRILEGIRKQQEVADAIKQDVDSTRLKVNNLKKVLPHYEADAALRDLVSEIEKTCSEL